MRLLKELNDQSLSQTEPSSRNPGGGNHQCNHKTKLALTIAYPPISTDKERIGLVRLASQNQLLAGAGCGTSTIPTAQTTGLSPMQNRDAITRRRNGH